MAKQIPDIPYAQQFDRITFACGGCQSPGIIRSVAVNLTMLVLEGECPACKRGSRAAFDLMEIDARLRGEFAGSDKATETLKCTKGTAVG
jgi:hypothetical protein